MLQGGYAQLTKGIVGVEHFRHFTSWLFLAWILHCATPTAFTPVVVQQVLMAICNVHSSNVNDELISTGLYLSYAGSLLLCAHTS